MLFTETNRKSLTITATIPTNLRHHRTAEETDDQNGGRRLEEMNEKKTRNNKVEKIRMVSHKPKLNDDDDNSGGCG